MIAGADAGARTVVPAADVHGADLDDLVNVFNLYVYDSALCRYILR